MVVPLVHHVLCRDLVIKLRPARMTHYGLTVCAALLYMAAAASAAQNYTNLCSCTDLLWQPQPSSAWEVINWHSKLVEELNAARATGVRLLHAVPQCMCTPGLKLGSSSSPSAVISYTRLVF